MTEFTGKLAFNDAGTEVDLVALSRRALRDAKLENLSYHRGEEVLRDLVLLAWQLSLEHDSAAHPGRFEAGCYRILRLRLKGELRERLGRTTWKFADRTHERVSARPSETLSLDAPVGPDRESRLGDLVRAGEVDSPERSVEAAALRGVLGERDRSDARREPSDGERLAQGTGRRTDRSGFVADELGMLGEFGEAA